MHGVERRAALDSKVGHTSILLCVFPGLSGVSLVLVRDLSKRLRAISNTTIDSGNDTPTGNILVHNASISQLPQIAQGKCAAWVKRMMQIIDIALLKIVFYFVHNLYYMH